MVGRVTRGMRGGTVKFAKHSDTYFKGYWQGGAQCSEHGWVVQISGFDRGISVYDRLFVVCYPPGESLAHWDTQGRKEAIVVPVDIFGDQFLVPLDVDRDGIVGDHRLELDREPRKSLTQTE